MTTVNIPSIPDHVYTSAQKYATQRGYLVVNSQLNFLEQPTIEFIRVFDLASPENPHNPKVRVFWTPSDINDLTEAQLQTAKSVIQDTTISLLTITNDGSKYRTVATIGSSIGSINFVPCSLKNSNNYSEIQSISDLQPFLTIYELRQLVSKLSDNIFASYGHDRLKLFDTMLMLIAAKIYDEVQHPNDLQLPKLLKKQDTDLRERFQSFCQLALKNIQCESFGTNLYLDTETLYTCLEMLIPYSFRLTVDIGAQTEILGTFYQETVSSTFRGSLGAYFTPKPIADLATIICEPSDDDDILDMSCGSGTFLLSAFNQAKRKNNSDCNGPRVFGCDIQERMVLTATLNSFLHGVYNSHIMHGDALRIDLSQWHALDASVPTKGFSLIVGNPPFAGFEKEEFLPYNHSSLAEQRGAGARVNKIIPFIAKTVQLLRPGGKAALVIPTSVLNGEAASFTDLRKWLSSEVEVTALIGLPREAFVHTDCGIEGALLFFKRKVGKSKSGDVKVFFKNLTNVGYDRRGRVISGSEADDTITLWKRGAAADGSWIALKELYQLDRWDPTWLDGHSRGVTNYSPLTHVCLTDLCAVVKRRLRSQDIHPDTIYKYFEVGDTDIDTGAILQIHTIRGKDLSTKGRLQIPVQEDDVLLPNHRDSLIAKTAARTGRSAVLVTSKENGCITSNRFTVLKPSIHPKLLILILNSDFVRKQLTLRARGSASFDVRDKVLDQVWIPKKIAENPKFQKEVLAAIKKREHIQHLLDEADAHLNQFMEAIGSRC